MSCLVTAFAVVGAMFSAACVYAGARQESTEASWYGEDHRGRLMANGQPFNPDRMTCASWFYPLGARLRVSAVSQPHHSVTVTVTDRGPARRLVARGRSLDLSREAFRLIHPLKRGLVRVRVERIR